MAIPDVRYGIVGIFLLGLLGCGRTPVEVSGPRALRSTSRNSLLIYCSDFTTGVIHRVDLPGGKVDAKTAPAESDAWPKLHEETGRLVVLNRTAPNHVSVVSRGFFKLDQFLLPEASNPQDVAFLGGRQAYVSFFARNYLSRVDLSTGEELSRVSLERWSDADGSPEAAGMYRWNDKVFVILQRLNQKTFRPEGSSYLLSVDPRWDRVEKSLRLRKPNPYGEVRFHNGEVWVGETGVLDRDTVVLDGGIERINPLDWKSEGWAVTEKDLGGDLFEFEILDERRGAAIIGTPATRLVLFDPSTGKKVGDILEGRGFQFPHLLVDRERNLFFVADRDLANPAIRVFDFAGKEKKEHRIGLRLPPLRMVLGE